MRIDLYVHGSKESALGTGEAAGLRGEALNLFMYAGSEHRMTYEVDPETGAARLVEVDGRAVAAEDQLRTERTAVDARLIAAAPDLLAACREALLTVRDVSPCNCSGGFRCSPCKVVDELHAAIDKAEGRS